MKYAVATMHDKSYQKLGDITNPNKQEYCSRHGYDFHLHICSASRKADKNIGFEKIQFTLDIFKQYPETEWLLFAEADTMITNLTIKLEDLIDNSYHFIVAKDMNNINAGVYLARNTPEGNAYLQTIHDAKKRAHHVHAEQFVMINTYKSHQNIIKIVNQRFFNSYNYALYPYHKKTIDATGQDGNWQRGDFIIHWVDRTLDQRIQDAISFTDFVK